MPELRLFGIVRALYPSPSMSALPSSKEGTRPLSFLGIRLAVLAALNVSSLRRRWARRRKIGLADLMKESRILRCPIRQLCFFPDDPATRFLEQEYPGQTVEVFNAG
jgi:hypothetical protein